jgi:HSP20 family protein
MATLVRWDPMREMAALQNELARVAGLMRGENGTTASSTWAPAMDVWETDDEVVYAFDVPGIPEDKISLEFEDGALTVSGERSRTQEVKEGNFYRFERRHGTFARTIGLPQGISEEQIAAHYTDGVLEVHVKKPEQQKPRRIQIGKSDTATIEGSATQA